MARYQAEPCTIKPRHSGMAPTGPRFARPDDRLRARPGISKLPEERKPISGFRVRALARPGMTATGRTCTISAESAVRSFRRERGAVRLSRLPFALARRDGLAPAPAWAGGRRRVLTPRARCRSRRGAGRA